MTRNRNEQRATRERMARTGENYTTALRKIREERAEAEAQESADTD